MSEGLPRVYPNNVNIAMGQFDVTITWLEHDPTILPDHLEGPHTPSMRATSQTVLSYGAAKALIPLLANVVAKYEQEFGVIPSPGFEENARQ